MVVEDSWVVCATGCSLYYCERVCLEHHEEKRNSEGAAGVGKWRGLANGGAGLLVEDARMGEDWTNRTG